MNQIAQRENEYFTLIEDWEQFPKEKTWLALREAALAVANPSLTTPTRKCSKTNFFVVF